MKILAALLLMLGLSFESNAQQNTKDDYQQYFTGETMRVDYFHTGTAIEEHFSIDHILNDGLWPGSETKLLDNLNRGLYFYKITDAASSKLIYSRGFASVFGEWQTIPEAAENWGTFHESLRFPWPKMPVTLTIEKRDAKNNFIPIWSTTIDPKSRIVNPSVLKSPFKTVTIVENGKASDHVDIVILGDGYTAGEMDKFHNDVATLTAELFNVEPFKSRKSDFNVRAVETPSASSGVNKPHPGVFNRTPLSMSYGAFDSERYALTYDNRTVRDVVVSGGDIANLPAATLEHFISGLLDIDNIRDIRLASKGLMGVPQHFLQDEVLTVMDRLAKKAVQRGVGLAMHTHINHAQSVTPLVAKAARKLLSMGFRDVRNQGVLMRGVNDSQKDLLDLCFKLQDHGSVLPYYFYMCDMIPNSEHWRVSVWQAQQLQHDIMGYLPGFATPRIVCDVPFVGKRWVHQIDSYDREKGISYWTKNYLTSIELKTPEVIDNLYEYYDPIDTLPAAGQAHWEKQKTT